MFEQFFEPAYIKSTDMNTLLALYKKDVDLSKLEGCNVVALAKMGFIMLFKIDYPSREVKCYSFGNDFYVKKDVTDVFDMIQNNCICWVEL